MNAQPARVDWSDLQLLVAVRAAGSMLQAANRLGVAASTIGRRLTALERATGAIILERGPRGIRLTAAGDALAGCGSEVELAIARTMRELPRPGSELGGTIRVTAGDGFADAIVAAIRAMATNHPRVRFELALEDRPVDLTRREADVGIRTVHLGEATLVYRKLGALPYGVFADARYLANRGSPRRLADLAGHAWIGFVRPLDRLPANRWLRSHVGEPPVLAASTFAGQLAAARAGLGLAALPVVAAAGLSAVLPQADVPSLPVWLVVHRDARGLPHVATFVDVLRTELASRLS